MADDRTVACGPNIDHLSRIRHLDFTNAGALNEEVEVADMRSRSEAHAVSSLSDDELRRTISRPELTDSLDPLGRRRYRRQAA